MPKLVILGSCLHEPYIVLAAPNKLDSILYETDHEKAYEEACRLFYPAIDHADIVLVWVPDANLKEHPHTIRDMQYAREKGKRVIVIYPNTVWEAEAH